MTDDTEEHGVPAEVATVLERPRLSQVRPVADDHTEEMEAPPGSALPPGRYVLGDVLGIGGMGKVVECRDRQLGRIVAKKILTDQESDTARARFLREVRVQAQLEHPAILPVYDLDVGVDAASSFTMKRVHGVTLKDAIVAARRGEVMRQFAPRRLLSAFANVCLAVDYAHRRGVIHRDLKPTNVMLGSYGEVYVLDWGVALVLDDDSTDVDVTTDVDAAGGDGAEVRTRFAGTPGYMAPEVIEGASRGTPESDVYALGAVLFAILAGSPLLPGSVAARLNTAVEGVDVDARTRELEVRIPPELLEVARRATARLGERYEDARQLYEDLQAYLDGDRDLALRRDMAQDLTRDAIGRLDGGEDVDRRSVLRDLVAALALEPAQDDAVAGLRRLLSEPPKTIPREVIGRLGKLNAERIVAVSTPAVLSGVLGVPLAFALAYVMGVRDYTVFGIGVAIAVAIVSAVRFEARLARVRAAPERPRAHRRDLASVLLMSVGIAAISTIAGPFVLVPAVAIAITIVRILRDGRQAWLVASIMSSAVLVPLALQTIGWLPSSYSFGPQGWLIQPLVVSLPRIPTLIWAAVCTTATVGFAAAVASRFRRELDAAELRNQLYLWQVGQLLPEGDE